MLVQKSGGTFGDDLVSTWGGMFRLNLARVSKDWENVCNFVCLDNTDQQIYCGYLNANWENASDLYLTCTTPSLLKKSLAILRGHVAYADGLCRLLIISTPYSLWGPPVLAAN